MVQESDLSSLSISDSAGRSYYLDWNYFYYLKIDIQFRYSSKRASISFSSMFIDFYIIIKFVDTRRVPKKNYRQTVNYILSLKSIRLLEVLNSKCFY